MPYTHLIFDFDHMLFDTDQSEALSFHHALRSHGVADPEPLLGHYQRINQGLWREVEKGTISPRADSNWSFAPMEGSTVLFDTGPAATAYLDQVDVNIEPAGDGPDGFARFRISL